MKLSDTAVVRSGVVLSRKQSSGPSEFRYPLLNMKSLREDGTLNRDALDFFDAKEELDPTYLTQIGDIVVRLSAPYTAILIDQAGAGIVVSSNFVIIRSDRERLLPEYLHWFLNRPELRQDITKHNGANMLGAIKAQYYADLQIPALSIPQQQTLGELNRLAIREAQLLQALAAEKKHYYELTISQLHTTMRSVSEV